MPRKYGGRSRGRGRGFYDFPQIHSLNARGIKSARRLKSEKGKTRRIEGKDYIYWMTRDDVKLPSGGFWMHQRVGVVKTKDGWNVIQATYSGDKVKNFDTKPEAEEHAQTLLKSFGIEAKNPTTLSAKGLSFSEKFKIARWNVLEKRINKAEELIAFHNKRLKRVNRMIANPEKFEAPILGEPDVTILEANKGQTERAIDDLEREVRRNKKRLKSL